MSSKKISQFQEVNNTDDTTRIPIIQGNPAFDAIISPENLLNSLSEMQQSDWNETDDTKADYIKNKPVDIMVEGDFVGENATKSVHLSDEATHSLTSDDAVNAEYSINDNDGNNIVTTYQKKLDNDLNTSSKYVVGAINEINSIAKNGQQALVFDDYNDLTSFLLTASTDNVKIGQTIFIKTINVADVWISTINLNSVDYTFIDDETFTIDILNNNGQIGYFNLSKMETGKVILENYVPYTGATKDVDLQDFVLNSQGSEYGENILVDGNTISFKENFYIQSNNGVKTIMTDDLGENNLSINPYNNYQKVDVNGDIINNNTIATKGIKLDVNEPYVVSNPGEIGWNATQGTFDMKLLNNTILQAGQELHIYAKAVGDISNGDVVQLIGSQGGHLIIKKAVQSEIITNPNLIIGVATDNISNGNFGYVTNFGEINNIYTYGYSEGDSLYFNITGSTAGTFTNVKPNAPYPIIRLGSILRAQTGNAENGKIGIRLTYSTKLQDLSDVNGTPLTTSGQILVWNNTTGTHDFTDNINNYSTISNSDAKYALQDGTILYSNTKWFIPQSNQTITVSSNGLSVTITNPLANSPVNYYFTSDMVGAKLTINGISRIISGYTSSSVVSLSSAFPTSMWGQSYPYTTWGVYVRILNFNGTNFDFRRGLQSGGAPPNSVILQDTGGFIKTQFSYRVADDFNLWNDTMHLRDSEKILWKNGNCDATADTGIRRESAGLLAIYDGITTSNYKDLKLRNITTTDGTNSITISGNIITTPVTNQNINFVNNGSGYMNFMSGNGILANRISTPNTDLSLNGGTNYGIIFSTNNSEKMKITSGGTVNILETVGNELAPSITIGNWILDAGFSISSGSLIRSTGYGYGFAQPSTPIVPVIGSLYKIVITAGAGYMGNYYLKYQFGGVSRDLPINATKTDYIVANTTDNFKIWDVSGGEYTTITSISIKLVTNGSGDVNVGGNLTVNGKTNYTNIVNFGTISNTAAPVAINTNDVTGEALRIYRTNNLTNYLSINFSDGFSARILNNSDKILLFDTTSTNNGFLFRRNSTGLLSIGENLKDNVGIGTSTPAHKLEINNTGSNATGFAFNIIGDNGSTNGSRAGFKLTDITTSTGSFSFISRNNNFEMNQEFAPYANLWKVSSTGNLTVLGNITSLGTGITTFNGTGRFGTGSNYTQLTSSQLECWINDIKSSEFSGTKISFYDENSNVAGGNVNNFYVNDNVNNVNSSFNANNISFYDNNNAKYSQLSIYGVEFADENNVIYTGVNLNGFYTNDGTNQKVVYLSTGGLTISDNINLLTGTYTNSLMNIYDENYGTLVNFERGNCYLTEPMSFNFYTGGSVEINSRGFLFSGDATFFDDLQGDITKTKTVGTRVTLNDTENTINFTNTSTLSDYVFLNFQMSHKWKIGSIIYPHIHWEQTLSTTPNWLIQYRWQKQGGPKTTAWTNYKCDVNVFTYTSGTLNQISNNEGITPPDGAGLSDIIEIRVIRDTANASGLFTPGNTYAATASITSIDIHYECSQLGSNNLYS